MINNNCNIQNILEKLQNNCLQNSNNNQHLLNNIELRLIKILDIGYISILYFFLGYYIAKFLDNTYNKYLGIIDNKKKYNKLLLIYEIIFQTFVTGIIIYFVRNIIYLIPFPLNKYHGFDHLKVKEVTSVGLLSTFVIMFQTNMTNRIIYFKNNY